MKKISTKSIYISDYDYDLPDNKVAKFPLKNRDQSKLLYYRNGEIKSYIFDELPTLIPNGSMLVFNNTKVIHARLFFKKSTGSKIEILCLSPIQPKEYTINFAQTKSVTWKCMIGNARRWKNNPLNMQIAGRKGLVTFVATKIKSLNQEYEIEFSWDNVEYTFSEILEEAGNLPIPPYLGREAEKSDEQTYQTIYSKSEGSIAAPTAGLHFSENVLNEMRERDVTLSEVTLHVGAGTFKPVKANNINEHTMHAELISVSKETISKILKLEEKLIVIGTTSLRTIESLYYIGVKLLKNQEDNKHTRDFIVEQWEPYDDKNNGFTKQESLQAIYEYLEHNKLNEIVALTKIIIIPGYKMKFADAIITNFHQPKSTLLLLISALVGKSWKTIYNYALENDFRFLSYGDSSLLWIE